MRHLPEDMKERLLGKYTRRKVSWKTFARWRDDMDESNPGWLIYKDRVAKVPGEPKAEERARRLLSRFARTS